MRRLIVAACAVGAVACAERGAAHIAPDESRPNITWEIRDGRGEERFVCSSTRQATACTISASTDQRRNPVTVHLSLHAAKAETRYLGLMRTPFVMGGDDPHTGEVSIAVPPGSAPVNKSLSGAATQKPGSYNLTIALDAMQQDQLVDRIEATVPVIIR